MSRGFLAVWNDLDPSIEGDYLDWHLTTHVPERMELPDFLRCRRFEKADEGAGQKYFTFFDIEDPAVLDSEDYRSLVGRPTSQTARMMTAVRRFTRAGGHRVTLPAFAFGPAVVTARLTVEDGDLPELPLVSERLHKRWVDGRKIYGVHAFVADSFATDGSPESDIRAKTEPDARFGALVLVEGRSEQDLRSILEPLQTELGAAGHVTCDMAMYRLQVAFS